MTPPVRPPVRGTPLSLQLLAPIGPLRTALRRACVATGGELTLAPDGSDDGDALATRAAAVVVDADLPRLRGLGLVRQLATSHPHVPLFVAAPDTAAGRALRVDAMEKGAAGFFLKPDDDRPGAFRPLADEIVAAVRRSLGLPDRSAPLVSLRPAPPAVHPAGPVAVRPARACRVRPEVLLVASSTGGPQALMRLFSLLEPGAVAVPVLIVQHMPATFTPILADHLTRATRWRAAEAVHDEPLTPGEIRIAPGGYHLALGTARGPRRLRLTDDPPVNFCRPSADVLFGSAVETFGGAVLSVILTGMGSDGCEGAKAIAAAGGVVFAQDRETSVVWGMPGAAVGAGVVHGVYAIDGIAPALALALAGSV